MRRRDLLKAAAVATLTPSLAPGPPGPLVRCYPTLSSEAWRFAQTGLGHRLNADQHTQCPTPNTLGNTIAATSRCCAGVSPLLTICTFLPIVNSISVAPTSQTRAIAAATLNTPKSAVLSNQVSSACVST